MIGETKQDTSFLDRYLILLQEQEREKALRGMVSDDQMDTMLEDLDLGQGQEQ